MPITTIVPQHSGHQPKYELELPLDVARGLATTSTAWKHALHLHAVSSVAEGTNRRVRTPALAASMWDGASDLSFEDESPIDHIALSPLPIADDDISGW
jgi:hypothetical protein